MFAASGGVDEAILAGVNAHMGNILGRFDGEENQIAVLQRFEGDRRAGPVLVQGDSGQFHTIETIDGHGQSAAIESALRGSPAPTVGGVPIKRCAVVTILLRKAARSSAVSV